MATGGVSLWGATQLLGEFFGRRIDWPTTFYLALIRTTAPGPFTEGGELDEPDSALGYLRATVPNDEITWTMDNEVAANTNDIAFAAATGDWGFLRYWALLNTDTGGQIYFYGDFGEAVPGAATDELIVPAGTLNIVLGPIFAGVG